MTYMGSKKKIMPNLNYLFNEIKSQHNLETFCDIFGGGANVSSNLTGKWRRIIYNDINFELVTFLKMAATRINEISSLETPDKETWYQIMKKEKEVDNLTFLSYKILGSFNGKVNGKSYGCINKGRDAFRMNISSLKKQKFHNIEFENLSYDKFFEKYKNMKKYLFYLDPPYINTTGYETEEVFNHEVFWEKAKEFSKEHLVLVSELTAPNDWKEILSVMHTHDMQKKEVVEEKVFIHKDSPFSINLSQQLSLFDDLKGGENA